MHEFRRDENWHSRTYGVLPEGSNVKRDVVDTNSDSEYGSLTWTNAQTLKDLLQNHLDANTDEYFTEIVSTLLDTTQPLEGNGYHFRSFVLQLFYYVKCRHDVTDTAKMELLSELKRHAAELPIKEEWLTTARKLDTVKIDALLALHAISVPTVRVRIVDVLKEKPETWYEYSELRTLTEQLPDSQFRYQITAVHFSDSGSGYDSKLAAIYKTTKSTKRYLRGKFGEGSKMSVLNLLRNGAVVKFNSAYTHTSEARRQRVWRIKPKIASGNTLVHNVTETDVPHLAERKMGSSTRIELGQANNDFQNDFLANFDPRLGEGLGSNCLEYSTADYVYPVVPDVFIPAVGVCLEADVSSQYVFGLKVDHPFNEEQNETLLFSYDFLDSSVLRGRDRNGLNDTGQRCVTLFWEHAELPWLLEELVRRVMSTVHENNPERRALENLIMEIDRSDQQRDRTRKNFLDLLPSVLGIEMGKKNIILKEKEAKPDLVSLLQSKDFHVIIQKSGFEEHICKKIAANYNNSFELYNYDYVIENMLDIIGKDVTENERTQQICEVYGSAMREIEELLHRIGKGSESIRLNRTLQFLQAQSVDVVSPVELVFNFTSDRFDLYISLDKIEEDLSTQVNRQYWMKELQIYILATIDCAVPFVNRKSMLMGSQRNAQMLLESSLHNGLLAVQSFPTHFEHTIEEDESAQLRNFEVASEEELLEQLKIFDTARKFKVSFQEIKSVLVKLNTLSPEHQEYIRELLSNRLFVENGRVGYCKSGRNQQLEFVTENIDKLPVVLRTEQGTVYHYGHMIFVLHTFQHNGVVRDGTEQYVCNGDNLLLFERNDVTTYSYSYRNVMIDNGCFYTRVYSRNERELEARKLLAYLSTLEIIDPTTDGFHEMNHASGVVETPIDIEYGAGEWDSPVSVFEDLCQNSIDAAPDRKILLSYEVLRSGNRLWITAEEMTTEDKITGITISDNGTGYAPDKIGTMGNTSKKSPFYAGKYGEGQKMVTAAVLRNGFELSFSSHAFHQGVLQRWTANAATRAEELIVSGEKSVFQRVVFEVESSPETNEELTSTTTLRLQDSQDTDSSVWQQWVKIFDPRLHDEHGHSGLARYVRNLRPTSDSVIDLGYMQILLDEPGVLYENGLRVMAPLDSVVGYDVPSIVTNRERNAYDPTKLSKYIGVAISECRDTRYHHSLSERFRDAYILETISKKALPNIKELDLNLSLVYLPRNFPSEHVLLRRAAIDKIGLFFVHSREYFQERIDLLSEKESLTDEEATELHNARRVQANLVHIPSDLYIDLPSYAYSNWSYMFPTAEEFISSLMHREVSVPASDLQQLATITSLAARSVTSMFERVRNNSESAIAFQSLLTNARPDSLDKKKLKWFLKRVQKMSSTWSDSSSLIRNRKLFVSPASNYDNGSVNESRIGVSESLLTSQHKNKLIGTIIHELLHEFTDFNDYIPEFILLFLEMAYYNTETEQESTADTKQRGLGTIHFPRLPTATHFTSSNEMSGNRNRLLQILNRLRTILNNS